MTFNDNARLDTSQVLGGKGGAIAGGGVGGIILLLVFVFLGGGSGSGSLPFDPSQVLQGDSRIAAFRLGEASEGGTGVTIVELAP